MKTATSISSTRGDGSVHFITTFNTARQRYETRVLWECVYHNQPGRTPFDGDIWSCTLAEAEDDGLTTMQAVHDGDLAWFDEEMAKRLVPA